MCQVPVRSTLFWYIVWSAAKTGDQAFKLAKLGFHSLKVLEIINNADLVSLPSLASEQLRFSNFFSYSSTIFQCFSILLMGTQSHHHIYSEANINEYQIMLWNVTSSRFSVQWSPSSQITTLFLRQDATNLSCELNVFNFHQEKMMYPGILTTGSNTFFHLMICPLLHVGQYTAVADDPETIRVRKNMETISNVAYHGELARRQEMENYRPGQYEGKFDSACIALGAR